MGYYISRKDKEILSPLAERMMKSEENISLQTQNPKRLAYLIRNAIGVIPEWQPLRDKYRIETKESKVVLKLKVAMYQEELFTETLYSPTLMEVMTKLFQGVRTLKIVEPSFERVEVEQIETYCNKNDYTVKSLTPTETIITKNG